MATDSGGAVERLEIEELRTVDEASDNLAHLIGLAIVDGHDPEELLGVVKGRGRVRARRGPAPADACEDLASDAQGVGVVLGKIFAEACHRTMELGAAERFVAGDF